MGVRRIWYVLGGEILSTAGPLELRFADESAVVLNAGPDGEALAMDTSRWVDPFAPPLSPENEQFVASSGKWTSFDVSDEEPYARVVGGTVDRVDPQMTPEGKLVGIGILAGPTIIRAVVGADELNVEVK
jgi:hypothetical protein